MNVESGKQNGQLISLESADTIRHHAALNNGQ